MAIETVQQFWSKAEEDESLEAKVQAIPADSDKEQALAEVLRIAAAAGFTFTAADFRAAVKEKLAQLHAAGQLSDDQLEMVAGGRRVPVTHPDCGSVGKCTGAFWRL